MTLEYLLQAFKPFSQQVQSAGHVGGVGSGSEDVVVDLDDFVLVEFGLDGF